MNNELLTTGNWQPTKEYVRNYQQNMQNKPNFLDGQMDASANITEYYENISDPTLGENKPNSNPIQSQTNPISEKPKMSVSSITTKHYENICPLAVLKNKPNSKPISQMPAINISSVFTKDYANQPPGASRKTDPICSAAQINAKFCAENQLWK